MRLKQNFARRREANPRPGRALGEKEMRATTFLFLSAVLLSGGAASAEPSDPAPPEPHTAPEPQPDAVHIWRAAQVAYLQRNEVGQGAVVLLPIYAGVAYMSLGGVGMVGFDCSIGVGGEGATKAVYFRLHYFQGVTMAGRDVFKVNPGVMVDWRVSRRIHLGLGAQHGAFIANNITRNTSTDWAMTLGVGVSIAVELYSWRKSLGKSRTKVSALVLETSGWADLVQLHDPLLSASGGLGLRL